MHTKQVTYWCVFIPMILMLAVVFFSTLRLLCTKSIPLFRYMAIISLTFATIGPIILSSYLVGTFNKEPFDDYKFG